MQILNKTYDNALYKGPTSAEVLIIDPFNA